MKITVALLAFALTLSAQTTVDLANQGKNVNFSGFPITLPVSVGTSLPATCTVGQLFFNRAAAAGSNFYGCTTTNVWTLLGGASGTGTVTSVGLSLPSIFNLTGSPVTTSGTFNATLASQSANLFLASPNGTLGIPAFRAILASDVPTLNQNTTGNSATTSAFATTPTLCATGNAPTGILANGNATGCAAIGSGGGGVSSVGLALPTSVFTLSGTPVTGTGTLTGVFSSQSANTFFAAPNGSSGTPSFRAILAADIPTLNQNTTGTAAALTATPTLCSTGQAPVGILANGNATGCAAIGGGASFPWTTNGDTVYYNGSAATRLAGPTAAQTYVFTETGTGSAPAAPVWLAQYALANGCGTTATTSGSTVTVNAVKTPISVTGTSDVITFSTDCGALKTYTNSAGVNVALPQPGLGGNWTTGQGVTLKSYSGALVVTPTGSSIGTGSTGGSFTVPALSACQFVSDGANWQLGLNCSSGGGGGTGTVTSVGLTLPSTMFSVAGSPVTASGTLAASYATGQTANYIFGGDSSGNVGYMAMTTNQLPSASSIQSYIGTNFFVNGLNTQSGANYTLASSDCNKEINRNYTGGSMSDTFGNALAANCNVKVLNSTSGIVLNIAFTAGTANINGSAGATTALVNPGQTLNLVSLGSGNFVGDSAINLVTTGGSSPYQMYGSYYIFGTLKLVPTTYASAPSCGSGNEGISVAITDGNTNTWGSAVTGGGSNHVKIYCDGTSYTVAAK